MEGTRKDLSLDRLSWEDLRKIIETDAWAANEEMASKLLKDGKVLTLEHLDNDYAFLAFLLYGKNRNRKLTAGTIKQYEIDIKLLLNFLGDPVGHFRSIGITDPAPPPSRLKEIGRAQLRAFECYVNTRYARNTAARKLSVVKSIVRFGYEKEYFQHNLRDEFSIGQRFNTMALRKLNYVELQTLMDEMRKTDLHRIIASLLFLKGLRVSELCGINLGDSETGLYGDTMVRIIRKGGEPARGKRCELILSRHVF